MTIPPKDHPIWPVITIVVMLCALGLCLSLGYSSSFDEVKDLRTMLIVGLLSSVTELIRNRRE